MSLPSILEVPKRFSVTTSRCSSAASRLSHVHLLADMQPNSGFPARAGTPSAQFFARAAASTPTEATMLTRARFAAASALRVAPVRAMSAAAASVRSTLLCSLSRPLSLSSPLASYWISLDSWDAAFQRVSHALYARSATVTPHYQLSCMLAWGGRGLWGGGGGGIPRKEWGSGR